MEILDLRLLRPDSLEPLLEEEKQLWRNRLQWDYSATAAWILRFVEARALAGYAALEEGRPVGYSFFVYEDYKGLIGGFFVSREFSNGATESRLMTHVLETLQATPGLRRIEAQLLHFGNGAIRQCLHSQDFQIYDRKFLWLRLREASAFSPSDDSGVEVVSWKPRWFAEAAELITRAYRGHVDSQISDQYRTRAGATRFLENMIRHAGCGVFQEQCSFLAFPERGGNPCGMVLTSLVQDRVAHITQLCVDPEFQGRGIGTRLIAPVLQTLQERGFEAVTLTVTAANTPALRLYEKLRFSTLWDFEAFAWDAAPERNALQGRNI